MASSSSSSAAATTPALSSNAEFIFTAVFKVQPSYEVARKYFAVLRSWAGSGKAYKGRVFSRAEVEEAISAFERSAAGVGLEVAKGTAGAVAAAALLQAGSEKAAAHKAARTAEAGKLAEGGDAKRAKMMGHFWPKWALDSTRGVQVLAPTGPQKSLIWTPAKPVGIGYRGQKKHFLFVRSKGFELDARRVEVRAPEGGPTVQELQDALLKEGGDPCNHPDWTDGSDTATAKNIKTVDFVAPGVAWSGAAAENDDKIKLIGDAGVAGEMFDELEGDFERMALLQRSRLVKIKTSAHPDPLTEPRAVASIQLPPLTEMDVLMMRADQAEKNLSSLQVETVTLAARRFRSCLADGRTCGYVIGDGTGCGKGRCIAALMMHMWNSGIKRHIWVSATNDLYYDACRDLKDLGADIPCITLKRLPPSAPLDRWGTETNKELFKHFGAEGDGIIFVTYSLLVQTGQRRQLIPIPVKTEEVRKRLLADDVLNEQCRVTRNTGGFLDASGMATELRKGDNIASVQNLRQLQKMVLPFTITIERVLHKEKKEKQAKTKDAFDAVDKKGIHSPDKKGLHSPDKKGKMQEPADANSKGDNGDLQDLTAWNSRLGQLVEWIGAKDAHGLICFDEVHKAKNLVPDKDDTASTKTGLFVDLLQRCCPKAPILYVSATAATEVKHLGYMGRLGLWGPGTAFEDFQDFAKAMESGGVSAMELLAINMKALGALSCKALAYVGTEFDTHMVGLTQDQRDCYNGACAFWQNILDDYKSLTGSKELFKTYVKKFFGMKEKEGMDVMAVQKRLWQFFWGAQQRFFKAMCNAAKVPAAAELAREAIEAGEQACLSIWATGEARSKGAMERLKDETPGRITIDEFSEGSLVKVTIDDDKMRKKVVNSLFSNMRLKQDVPVGKTRVRRSSQLLEVHGRKVTKREDLSDATLPAILLFRFSSSRWLDVSATLTETNEKVRFELRDDELGERVVVAKVHEGPVSFRRAATEQWHVKLIGNRPVGKTSTARLAVRLRKGHAVAFHDPVVAEHLSGPEMILEHFVKTIFLTTDEDGNTIEWARDLKEQRLKDMKALKLPPNAMDELVDLLGGPRKVAEMSGRSHRMKRKKDGSLAYVARSEELRCSPDGVNMVEQEFFQKGIKKACILTEVAAAGISLHADRRQVRKDYAPPRRLFISVELPWGADKAIQSFGRVHRANQLQPPRFKILVSPIAGEVRFTSAIARRMKLLGAVTKGDRMTSMGGGADRHMAEFDVNNIYGVRAMSALYSDTTKITAAAPDLLALYETMRFLGTEAPATGRWPDWVAFAHEVAGVWKRIRMYEDLEQLLAGFGDNIEPGSTKESNVLNRFFNRILMLDIDLQNAMFEVFFAIYSELVRIDKSNGEFDEGVENLNDWYGRRINRVEIEHSEVLYTDPRSGAEARYHILSLDRGTNWEDAKEMFDKLDPCTQEGFYCYRAGPSAAPEYFLAKEREQVGGAGDKATTWHARRRKRQYVIWKPDFSEGSRQIALEMHLEAKGCEKLEGAEELKAVETAWTRRYEETKSNRLIRMHVLTGDVLTVWRLAKRGVEKAVSPKKEELKEEVDDASLDAEGNVDMPAEEEMQKPENSVPEKPVKPLEPEKPVQPLEIGGIKKELQVVRAITQPEGVPIVGLKVDEADLPKLRYVLSCQHKAVRETAVSKKTLREVTMEVASTVAKRVREAPERKLPFATWFDVHKVLAADGIVTYSATGMRGTQDGVERLLRAQIITIGEDGMTADIDIEDDDELEQVVFPEEFAQEEPEDHKTSLKKKRTGDGILDDWEEALFDEEEDDDLDDDDALNDLVGDADASKAPPRQRLSGKFALKQKKKQDGMKEKKDKKDKKEKKEKKRGKESKEERQERKKRQRLNKYEEEDAPATFEDLFGAASNDGASDPDCTEPGPSSKLRPPATPSKAPTPPSALVMQLRDEVGRVLEGLDLASTSLKQVRSQMEANLSMDPGSLDEHKDYIDGLLQEKIQHMQSPDKEKIQHMQSPDKAPAADVEMRVATPAPAEPAKPSTAGPPAAQEVEKLAGSSSGQGGEDYGSWPLEKIQETLDNMGEESDGDRATLIGRLRSLSGALSQAPPSLPLSSKKEELKESEKGFLWTYEVTGKNIGIREGPSVDSNHQGDYIENGELFNVTERLSGGGDVRVYLRLADGRGWAYDRSAKDESKVIVEELGAKPVVGAN